MKKLFIYILFCFYFSSCSSQDKEKLAGQYNNTGTDLMMEAYDQDDENSRKELLKKAIVYFDSSINLHPTMVNYGNKIKTQCKLGEFDKALMTIQDQEIQGATPESTTMKGFILERTGKTVAANKLYLQAIELYKERIPMSKDPISDQLNIAFLKGFTENVDSAKKEIKKILKENPGNEKAQVIKETFDHFDRKEFISELGN